MRVRSVAWRAAASSKQDRYLVPGMAFQPAGQVEFDQDKLYLGRFQPGMADDLVHSARGERRA